LSSISKILDVEADGIKILQEFRPKFQLELGKADGFIYIKLDF
jgi:hypothetical protein